MYEYIWDDQTGGILLTTNQSKFSKEPRPVYSRELDILGFDQYWNYPHDDSAPIMWAEANNYYYRGKLVAKKSYFMDEYQQNTKRSSRHLKIRCNGMKIMQSVFRIGKS